MSELSPADKLNGRNYEDWSFKIKMYLLKENLWDIVENPPPLILYGDWDDENTKAMGIIGLSLADNQVKYVKYLKNAHEYWVKLSERYEKSVSNKKFLLLRQFLRMNLRKNQTMQAHLDNMMEVIGKLISYGDEYDEKFLITKILSSLPYEYDNLILFLESVPEKDLKIDYIKEKLLLEYDLIKNKNGNSDNLRNENYKFTGRNKNFLTQSENKNTVMDKKNELPPSYNEAINENRKILPQQSSMSTRPNALQIGQEVNKPNESTLSQIQQVHKSNPMINPFMLDQPHLSNNLLTSQVPILAQAGSFKQEKLDQNEFEATKRGFVQQQCSYCKKMGHLIKNCRIRIQKETSSSRPTTISQAATHNTQQGAPVQQCFYCKQFGHILKDCRTRIQKETGPPRTTVAQNNTFRQDIHKKTVPQDTQQSPHVQLQCFYCKQFGHILKDCRTRIQKETSHPRTTVAQNNPFRQDVHKKTVPQDTQQEPHVHQQCFYCKQLGHELKNCHIRIQNEITETFDLLQKKQICSYCGAEGHKQENCEVLADYIALQPKCTLCNEIGHKKKNCRLLVENPENKNCVIS